MLPPLLSRAAPGEDRLCPGLLLAAHSNRRKTDTVVNNDDQSAASSRAGNAQTEASCQRHRRVASSPIRGLAPGFVGQPPIGLPALARADAIDGGGAGELRSGSGIEHHQRPAVALRLVDRVTQEPPIGADRLVGLAEMLLGPILDRSHRLAGPLVVNVDVEAHSGEGVARLLVRVEAVI